MSERTTKALLSIFELGVDQAYALVAEHVPMADMPPLDAIENEDWGRDYVLSRLASLDDETLASLGLCRQGNGSTEG